MIVEQNLLKIKQEIKNAAEKCNRNPSEIKLLAVSKKIDIEKIENAISAGQKLFGENYVQEMLKKMDHCKDDLEWHFIGSLQRNKVKYIVDRVFLIHSVNNLKLAEEIDKRAGAKNIKSKILVEVNISKEETKSGIFAKDVLIFFEKISSLKNVEVHGLMTMPPFFENPEDARPYFKKLRELLMELSEKGYEILKGKELSMGMSHDFRVAIEEGATIVRIGTAIFGQRER